MHHVKDSVKEYSRIIATGLFLRIHRSFIVSKLKIRSFNKQEIILDDGFCFCQSANNMLLKFQIYFPDKKPSFRHHSGTLPS